MDFSFLRTWFSTADASTDSTKLNNVEQSNLSKEIIELEMDEFEFINPSDPNEIHSLPSSYQIDKSIVEVAGFNKEKLLEMSNFCKISYGDGDDKLGEKSYKALVYKTDEFFEDEKDFAILENEKMYKTRAELANEGYEIIPFGNGFEEDAGHVFIKDKEITIAYHGTRFKHGLWGLNDVITDFNTSFTTSELLPEGGRIHRGFYSSFMDSWSNLYGILKSYAEKQGSEIKDFKINLTGHSMGGAVAKIAALCLNKTEGTENVHVATFGDPRVFDLTASEIYNDALQETTIRVTQHRQDPVPAVAPGLLGYAHVGAQLRVSTPDGYAIHKIDGYHEAIYRTDKNDFQSNNNVSLFYYPIRMLNRVNCAVFGNAQYYAANLGSYILGRSNFFEEVKNTHKNSSKFEQVKVEPGKNLLSTVIGG
ncbi:lipase family protein [Candidatus Wolbachia massiliensis]|uniref:Lipase family protein n=1 Tax=Candidatus Wolbachia massiliensis TaxID=1845000 RepID=A0A7M3U2D4_9RICK|nr:lipase family protein [Candidatus Wolbachia massiliensis]QOD38569.1 lipase family protein [Candidatus Wolbachia massiliensis]